MKSCKSCLWLCLALLIVGTLAESASACTRCGLFGRRCKFASVAVVDSFAVAPYAATPTVLTIQNNYNAPNGAAAFLAPQGQSVYGLTQAAQPYTLSPDAVLRQAAELTKGAQSLAQQGLNGYNQTASLALTLSATQPAMQAAALTAPQQLNSTRSSSQSIKLTQNANGQWMVEAGTTGGTPTQPATDSGTVSAVGGGAQADTLQPAAPVTPQGPSLVAKHCASCHGQDLAAPKGKLFYDAGLALDCGPGMSAVKAVMSGKMPKGVALSPEEKGQLIQELAALTKLR